MRQLFIETIRPLYYFITRPKYRAYYSIFSKLVNARRYKEREVSFLNYRIRTPDAVSFAYQFREIFMEESYKFVSSNSRPVIVDCGANVGLSCLYFLSIYPEADVTAYEADPKIFEYLKHNIHHNASSANVQLINAAAWTDTYGVRFSQEGADGGAIVDTPDGIEVPSVRLKDVLQCRKVDFLKIDIEGAEVKVLLDCSDSLKDIPFVFFEYHSKKTSAQQLHILLGMMQRLGFRYFILSPSIQNQPYIAINQLPHFDLQLNVYCYKPE